MPTYKVKDQPKLDKNSDMGSDGGYFSGPHDGNKSDEEYKDFVKQEFDDNDQLISEDDFGIPVDEDNEVDDSYLQSQFDYMYSQSTQNHKEND